MNITLKLFSLAKDLAGFEERPLNVDDGVPAEVVLQYLTDLNPQFNRWKSSICLAVNYEYVPADHLLREGDEVAVIPPVSGG
ncbi:MAG: MoaD/ThiS family protein [Bacteroidota bacterium]